MNAFLRPATLFPLILSTSMAIASANETPGSLLIRVGGQPMLVPLHESIDFEPSDDITSISLLPEDQRNVSRVNYSISRDACDEDSPLAEICAFSRRIGIEFYNLSIQPIADGQQYGSINTFRALSSWKVSENMNLYRRPGRSYQKTNAQVDGVSCALLWSDRYRCTTVSRIVDSVGYSIIFENNGSDNLYQDDLDGFIVFVREFLIDMVQ